MALSTASTHADSVKLCDGGETFSFERLNLEDINLLLASTQERDKEQLIAKLIEAFPELHFIVLDYSQQFTDFSLPEASLNKIIFRDKRVADEEIEHLTAYFSELGNFGGVYLFPTALESGFTLRKHVIALPNNAPRESILHEVLHFLHWRARNQSNNFGQFQSKKDWSLFHLSSKYGWTEEQKAEFSRVRESPSYFFPEYMLRIKTDVGEHLDISVFLLRYGKELGISEDELGRTFHLFTKIYLFKYRGLVHLDPQTLKTMMSENIEHYGLSELNPKVWDSIAFEIQDSRKYLLCLKKEFSLDL